MNMVGRLVLQRTRSLLRTAWLIGAITALVSITLIACHQTTDSEDIRHTRDPRAADLVVIASSTPIFQNTATLAVPTEMPIQTATTQSPPATPSIVDDMLTPTKPPCANEYFFDPSPEVCPSGAPQDSAAAEQPFERGFMIWLEATDSIYVFDWSGHWRQFEDAFEEGQPENDPALIPPAGLYQPVRGFGKVWRENPEVQEQLGWAKGRELGYESALQAQEVDAADLAISFIRTFNGQILALTNRSSDGGDWVIAAS